MESFDIFSSAVPSRMSAQPIEQTLGALGEPIRRINTFTASLPSFEEGEEKPNIHDNEGLGVSGIGIHPPEGWYLRTLSLSLSVFSLHLSFIKEIIPIKFWLNFVVPLSSGIGSPISRCFHN